MKNLSLFKKLCLVGLPLIGGLLFAFPSLASATTLFDGTGSINNYDGFNDYNPPNWYAARFVATGTGYPGSGSSIKVHDVQSCSVDPKFDIFIYSSNSKPCQNLVVVCTFACADNLTT